MPFPQQEGTPFTRAHVESLRPNQYGCYGLFNTHWVYIGMGDIRDRLLAHLNGDNGCITRNWPTHFYTWVTASAEREEERLLAEINTLCNVRAS